MEKELKVLKILIALLFIMVLAFAYGNYKQNQMNDCIMQNIHNYDYDISKRTCEIELGGN